MNESTPISNEAKMPLSEEEYNFKKIEDLKRIRQDLTQSIETQLQKFFEGESNRIDKINMYLSSRNFEEQQLKNLFPEHLIIPNRMLTTIDLREFRILS